MIYTQLTQINKIEKLPENFTDLTISYSSDKSEINSIKLILNNSYRNFSVTGTDGKKTDAIFRDISEQISSKIGFFAFVPWNMILSIISMAVIWACSVFGVTTIIQSRKTGGRTLYWGIFLSILSLIVFCIFLTQISSDSPLFPGFSILSDEVEWYNKYGNLITLISIIISIVVSIGPIISWAKNKKVIRN